jgi:hypothetical protein
MTDIRKLPRRVAQMLTGNATVIAAAAMFSLAVVFFAAASNQPVDAPDASNVVQQLVDETTAPEAPSVNLTPNDPGYMSTTPVAADPVESTTVEPPAQTSVSTTPPVIVDEPTPVEVTLQPTPAPTTTAPVTPPSPQADPNIVPLVIAWDGLKCPQPESYYVQARGGSFLLCPMSIRP